MRRPAFHDPTWRTARARQQLVTGLRRELRAAGVTLTRAAPDRFHGRCRLRIVPTPDLTDTAQTLAAAIARSPYRHYGRPRVLRGVETASAWCCGFIEQYDIAIDRYHMVIAVELGELGGRGETPP